MSPPRPRHVEPSPVSIRVRRWTPRVFDALLPATDVAGEPAARRAHWHADTLDEYCFRCGASSAPEAVTITGCAHCRERAIKWDRLFRLGAYGGDLARWLIDLKFHRVWHWADFFGRELARVTAASRAEWGGGAVVTPVPLHWRRRLVRGYDQSALIARRFAHHAAMAIEPLLRRRRATRAQTGIGNRDARARNLRGAFSIDPIDLDGRTVWLIDDVATTGATLGEAAGRLRDAGAERVVVAVVAVADPGDLAAHSA